MTEKKQNIYFRHDDRDIEILADALKKAFKKVDCDLRCFDWLSYNPDFYIKQQDKKAA